MAPATRGVVITAVHATLVVWLTWPLVTHLGTSLPDTWRGCRSDSLHIAWALSYESHALSAAAPRMADANIYHPTPGALFYGEAGFGALPYFIGPYLLSGNPALALNLTFLVSRALTAAALHAVVWWSTGSHLGGLIAAWTFLTTPWVRSWVAAAPHYAVLQYFPLVIFLAATPLRAPRRAFGLLSLVVIQGLTSVYVAAAVLGPLGLLALVRASRLATRDGGLRLCAVTASAALALFAAYARYLPRTREPSLATQSVWRYLHLGRVELPWALLAPGRPTGVPVAALILIAVGAVSLARRGRGGAPAGTRAVWRQAAFWAVAGIVISIPPDVRWFGAPIWVPQRVLAARLPVYAALRDVSRLGVATLIALAILAGLAHAECTKRLRERSQGGVGGAIAGLGFTGLVGAAMLALWPRPVLPTHSRLNMPRLGFFPLQDAIASDSILITAIRAREGALLELPVSELRGLTSAAPNARAMYRSIFHWRPLLNGYNGYWPPGFPERMALARRLPDPKALADLRRQTGLAMVLVHTSELGQDQREACGAAARILRAKDACAQDFGAAERAMWLGMADAGGQGDLHLLAREGEDLLFAVTPEGPPLGSDHRVPLSRCTPDPRRSVGS